MLQLRRLLIALILPCALPAAQPSVDSLIVEGRAALAAHDLATARARFTEARAAAPDDQTAAALLGITRLFALTGDTSSQAFLDGLGIDSTGRDLYHWSAEPAFDDDGNPILPAGYNASSVLAFLRDTVAPEAAAARADLAAVTDANFLLSLTSDETAGVSVRIDRGDLLLCQAGLRAFECVVHYLGGQNLDADLPRVMDLARGDMLSLPTLLEENPMLLATGSSSERLAAHSALLDAIALYRQASVFIRNRPPHLERLFMLDEADRPGEADLRSKLATIEDAVDHYAALDSGAYGTLAPLFSGGWSWRDQVPADNSGHSFNPYGIDDTTVGGVVVGLTRQQIAAQWCRMGFDADLGWEQVNPLPVGHNLAEYVWTGTSHIVVGNAGTVGRSTDGTHWTYQQLPDAKDLYAIAAGNGLVVAAGVTDIWISSDDGINWARTFVSEHDSLQNYSDVTGSFTDVVFTGDAFVAISSTGAVWRSTNGFDWGAIHFVADPGSGLMIGGMTFAQGHLVAVGRVAPIGSAAYSAIYTSTDSGATWIRTFTGTTSSLFRGAGYGDGRFLATGTGGRAAWSADGGFSWTETSIGESSDYFYGIAYVGGQFVIAGVNGRVATSPDGNTWTFQSVPATLPAFYDAGASPDGVFIPGSAGSIYRLAGGVLTQVDENVSFAPRNTTLNAVQAVGGRLFALGSAGGLFVSTDGENFNPVETGISVPLYSICQHAGTLYASGASATIIASNDGVNWQQVLNSGTAGTSAPLYRIASLNGQLFAVGSAGSVFTSPDGISWTKQLTGATDMLLRDIAFTNNVYVAAGSAYFDYTSGAYQPRILISTDAVNWTISTIDMVYGASTPPDLRSVVASGQMFYLFGIDGRIYSSYSYGGGQFYWERWPDLDRAGGVVQAAIIDDRVYASANPAFPEAYNALHWAWLDDTWGWDNQWLRSPLPTAGALYGPAIFGNRLYVAGGYGEVWRTRALPSTRPGPEPLEWRVPVASVGSRVTLVAPVVASEHMTYQWSHDGVVIDGAYDAVLTLDDVQLSSAGSYSVVATGWTTDSTAELYLSLEVVDDVPRITAQPVGGVASLGGQFGISVSATGTGPLTYAWFKNNQPLPGQTSPSLSFLDVTAADAGTYRVEVTNDLGTTVSSDAILAVDDAVVPAFWNTAFEDTHFGSPSRTINDGQGHLYAMWSVDTASLDVVGGDVHQGLVRLDESTGEVDPSFQWNEAWGVPLFLAIEPDGHLLVAVRLGAGESATVIRLAADGTRDAAFVAPHFSWSIRFLTRQSDGRILVAATDTQYSLTLPAGTIQASQPTVYRLMADGTLDSSFTPVSLNSTLFWPPTLDASGRIYLVGGFTSVNGVSRKRIARLGTDGTVDAAFPTGLPSGFNSSQARAIGFQSDGRVIIAGDFYYATRGSSADPIMAIRFDASGAFDSTFAQPLRGELTITNGVRLRGLIVTPDDKFVALSDRLLRCNADGSLDSSFPIQPFPAETYWISRSPTTGDFFVPQIFSEESGGIVAFSADGTRRADFDTRGWGYTTSPTSAIRLADGRVLAAGSFDHFGRSGAPALALFDAGGAPAKVAPFNPSPVDSPVTSVGRWPDGSFVVSRSGYNQNDGENSNYLNYLERYTADGNRDYSWYASLYNQANHNCLPMPSGRLLLWTDYPGAITWDVPGYASTWSTMLATWGYQDWEFNPQLDQLEAVVRDTDGTLLELDTGRVLAAQALPDDSLLVALVDAHGANRVVRLHRDGTLDTSYHSPDFGLSSALAAFDYLYDEQNDASGYYAVNYYQPGPLQALAARADGSACVVVVIDGATRLIRLAPDGSIDSGFAAITLANSASAPLSAYVTALSFDDYGRLYFAGRFDHVDDTDTGSLARLAPDGTFDADWIPDVAVEATRLTGTVLLGEAGWLDVLGSAVRPGSQRVRGHLRTSLTAIGPVVIQPQDRTFQIGDEVWITPAVYGGPDVTYKWYHNDKRMPDATGPCLQFGSAEKADAGDYMIVVTNPQGVVSSAPIHLTLAPIAQTIDFPAPGDRPFTTGGLGFEASSSSGLTVQFSIIAGPANVDDNTVFLLGFGAVTVRASQPGDSEYAAATPVDRTFEVYPTFDGWQALHFTAAELDDPSRSGPTAVYGHDGLPNLLKYALGLDPTQDARTSFVTSVDANYFSFTFTRPADRSDLIYWVESSPDLGAWGSEDVTLELISTSGGIETWRATSPSTGHARLFFRLVVLQNTPL